MNCHLLLSVRPTRIRLQLICAYATVSTYIRIAHSPVCFDSLTACLEFPHSKEQRRFWECVGAILTFRTEWYVQNARIMIRIMRAPVDKAPGRIIDVLLYLLNRKTNSLLEHEQTRTRMGKACRKGRFVLGR